MKHFLIIALLFSFTPRPAKAEIGTIVIVGAAVMVGLIVGDQLDKKED